MTASESSNCLSPPGCLEKGPNYVELGDDCLSLSAPLILTLTLYVASTLTLYTSQLERVLTKLDKRHTYFTVTQFAGLILAERIDIPCDLKLTLFAGGGDQDKEWAPHLGVVPIPLLAGVRNFPLPTLAVTTHAVRNAGSRKSGTNAVSIVRQQSRGTATHLACEWDSAQAPWRS